MKTVGSFSTVLFFLLAVAVGSVRAGEPTPAKRKAEGRFARAITVKKVPKPVVYDNFSDGRWEKRTGKDPWGRKLPEWKFEAHHTHYQGARKGITASKGFLSYEYRKGCKVSIPSSVAYGTWEWKYRFPGGRNVYSGRTAKYFFVRIISTGKDAYSRGLVSDGHSWFTRPGGHPGSHLLHNIKSGWGTGLFVDKRWHVCRITRDRKKGFTIYHDNRIITSGWGAGNPRDNGKNGLFTEVKDDTLKVSKSFEMTMQSASSPGSIDVDDIKIYDVVVPAPTDIPLRELWAIGEGKNPAKLPRKVNYAGEKAGAKASGGAEDANAGQTPKHMIDGITTDYDGGRGCAYAKGTGYLTVQLKQARTIEDIYLSLWDFTAPLMARKAPGPRKYDFEVDVSIDGKTWTNVAKREKAVQLQKISVGGRKVRYIRMRGRHYREYQHAKYPTPPKVQRVVDEFYVVEVEAYGPAAK